MKYFDTYKEHCIFALNFQTIAIKIKDFYNFRDFGEFCKNLNCPYTFIIY